MTPMTYVWLAAVVLFVILEGMTTAFVSLWFAGGAAIAFFVALLGGKFTLQFVIFVVSSGILLAALRPLLRNRVMVKRTATNADRHIGMTAIVTETIDNIEATGAAKVDGVVWTARSDKGTVIQEGALVRILKISGVKLIVEPVE